MNLAGLRTSSPQCCAFPKLAFQWLRFNLRYCDLPLRGQYRNS
jgi:hypothetical protein